MEFEKVEIKLGVYRHFKSGDYYILYDFTSDSEDGELRLSYMRVRDKTRYSRKGSKFIENVEHREDNLMKQKHRFEFIGATAEDLEDSIVLN